MEEKFREIFEKSPIGILFYDKEGKLINVNQSALKIERIPKFEDVKGISLFVNPDIEFRKEELLKKGIIKFQSSRELNKTKELGFYTPTESGIIHIDYTVSITDSGFLMQIQDITKQKEAEETLRESEVRFRSVLDNSLDALYRVNLKTNQYEYLSPAFEDVVGFSPKEFTSMTSEEAMSIIHPDDLSVAKESLARLEIERHVKVDYRVRDREGKYRWLSNLISLIRDDEGQPLYRDGTIRNITEQKNDEEALRQSEESLRAVFDNAAYGIVIGDLEGYVLKSNPAIDSMLGYSKDELQSMHFSDFTHPNDIMKEWPLIDDLLAGKADHYKIEKRYIHKDGSFIWVKLIGSFIAGPNGEIINGIALIEDITEQKKTQDELKNEHELLQTIIDTIPVMITIYNPKDLKFQVNKELERVTGWTNEDAQNIDLMAAVYPDPKYREMVTEYVQSLASGFKDLKMVTKDGSVIETSWANVNIPDGRQVGIGLDIRERKKSEEELKQARDNLEVKVEERTKKLEKIVEDLKLKEYLLDSANDSIFLHDLEGNIIYVNDAAYKSRGYTKEELLSMNIQDLIPPKFNEEIAPQINEIKKQGESIFESADLHKNGTIILIEIHSRPININNKFFILSVVRDITEKKKAEKQLKETIKDLERSNEELQQFAYVSSHDLQEPLRTIASFTQLLQIRYEGKFDSDADEFMEYIVEAAKRMKAQIEGLLEYSRVGTQEGDFKPVNMNKILNQTIKSLNTSIEEADAKIIRDKLPTVMGDAKQLERVFLNLISNAIRFRKSEEPPKINISANKNIYNSEYVFGIKDNGIGIEEQYSERIFTIFQRLHTREVYKGTGIGLSIVKRIIERHGGRIWVESEFGVGSTFYFTIPVDQVAK